MDGIPDRPCNIARMQNEIWKPIPGYETLYEASDQGRVRRSPTSPKTGSRAVPGAIKRATLNPAGYWQMLLSKDGRMKCVRVHTLVAAAFFGEKPSGHEINHKDCVKTNNVPENLEYLTKREHEDHTMRMGRKATGQRHGSVTKPGTLAGEKNPCSKLTESDVLKIRKRVADGETYRAIATDYKIDRTAVGLVARRKNWSHIP